MPESPRHRPDRRPRRLLRQRRLLVFAGILAALWLLAYPLAIPVVSAFATAAFWVALAVFAGWILWRLYQRVLWHVGGRLAFSYFLIGVVPIPLFLALVLIVGYGLTGFYLSRVFHDAVGDVQRELALTAATGGTAAGSAALEPVATARYREGRKVEGSPLAPEVWPGWLAEGTPEGSERSEVPAEEAGAERIWVELPDGSLTLAGAAASGPGSGGLAFYAGDPEALLRRRAGIWVQVGEAARRQTVRVGGVEMAFGESDRGDAPEADEAAAEAALDIDTVRKRFFDDHAEGGGWHDRGFFSWGTISERPVNLATGEPTADQIGVFLQASPRMVARSLFAGGAEIVHGFWIALLVSSLLLLAIYAVAELVAIAMIVGLSRAVSRLYTATQRVAAGDFSVRIPVRRRDQVGDVQRSFNSMAENLEDLVSTVAQKELLDKELQMARQVQQSLIPRNLPADEAVEFSTLFEPSAAIGGDYFDVLRLGEGELAVVVADVSGHGLPTGLRMAMVKAALGILVVETHEADQILRRLDGTVRSGGSVGDESRFFVTAVFSKVDFRGGTVEITNAGHPPVYLLRRGEVEEILLPGSPLGGLGHTYGRRRVDLEDGDVLVWLSDGLIEAADPDDEPFGYDRIEAALAGPGDSAAQVRDRLLAAVAAHTRGRMAMDDRTLVVMRYQAP